MLKRFVAVLLFGVCLTLAVFWSETSKGEGPAINSPISVLREKINPQKILPKKEITILVAGDLMLDRYVGKVIKDKGPSFPFEEIKTVLLATNLVLVNLEGSFTDYRPKPLQPDNLYFTFDPQIIPTLKSLNFKVFSLANNHTLNFGYAGLNQGKNYLKNSNLYYFGDPKNNGEISTIIENDGWKIGLVGYNQLENVGFEKVLSEINFLRKQVNLLIVYPHWGVEYQQNFSKSQQQQAHQMIDAGADIIYGSHPHVIQPIEVYKGKAIFYSLGNFLFDQTFSKATQQGLLVKTQITESEITFYLWPTETKNFQINLTSGKTTQEILKRISENSIGTSGIRQNLLEGKFTLKKD